MSFTTFGAGGEYMHKLDYYEMPNHSHNEYAMIEGYSEWDSFTPIPYSMLFNWGKGEYRDGGTYRAARVPLNSTTSDEGGSRSHNNIQPYIVVYFWRRIN